MFLRENEIVRNFVTSSSVGVMTVQFVPEVNICKTDTQEMDSILNTDT